MLQTNPNDRWNIEQVDSEIKRINLKSNDIFEGEL
jgi:hypothetical protein